MKKRRIPIPSPSKMEGSPRRHSPRQATTPPATLPVAPKPQPRPDLSVGNGNTPQIIACNLCGFNRNQQQVAVQIGGELSHTPCCNQAKVSSSYTVQHYRRFHSLLSTLSSLLAFVRSGLRPSLVRGDSPRNAPLGSPPCSLFPGELPSQLCLHPHLLSPDIAPDPCCRSKANFSRM